MGYPIRYLVPYVATMSGIDVASGKKISNNLYVQSNVQTVAPPAYGQPIAGSSSTTTLLTNLATLWYTAICTRMNHNYSFNFASMYAILGKRYPTPIIPISALVTGPVTYASTPFPHGYVTGQQVSIQGVGTPANANGDFVITVTTPDSFQINGLVTTGLWSGDGSVQSIAGKLEWLLGDKESQVPGAYVGQVAGDAMPLFATSSIRRLNNGTGRHFRSRFSLSPMSEIDALDGGFTTTQKPLMVTALTALLVAQQNGGSDATSKFSPMVVVSKQIAFTLASPFTQQAVWVGTVTSMVQQPNMGSLVRRKPKQTQVIT